METDCLKCPVCGEKLQQHDMSLKCAGGHSFDIARQGYVNLLLSNRSSSKRHGDDKLMVQARRQFLEKGYYCCLQERLCQLASELCGEHVELLDVGCGEGWYTASVRTALLDRGKTCHAYGIDISRAALISASRRDRELSLAVASVRNLPIRSSSIDLLISVFAPVNDDEFCRVLKKGGIMLFVAPTEEHLMGLKAAVYGMPRLNPRTEYEPRGFVLLERDEIRDRIKLGVSEDIQNLFKMTPYYYKTGIADQQKLVALDELETEIGFYVFVFQKE